MSREGTLAVISVPISPSGSHSMDGARAALPSSPLPSDLLSGFQSSFCLPPTTRTICQEGAVNGEW